MEYIWNLVSGTILPTRRPTDGDLRAMRCRSRACSPDADDPTYAVFDGHTQRRAVSEKT